MDFSLITFCFGIGIILYCLFILAFFIWVVRTLLIDPTIPPRKIMVPKIQCPTLLTHDEIEKELDKALDYKPTQLEMEIMYASNKAHGGIKCAARHASQYGSYCRVCGVKIK